MKRIYFLGLGLMVYSLQLAAADTAEPTNDWSAPVFVDEAQKILLRHVDDKSRGVGEITASGAKKGFALPWLVAFFLGAAKGAKEIPSSSPGWGGAILGGFAGVVILSPIALVTSLPLAAGGTIGGLGKGIFKGIRGNIEDPGFKNEVALHLYSWISATKQGRLAIRKEIEDWQKNHNEASIKVAIAELLKDDHFKSYCDKAKIETKTIEEFLKGVDEQDDKWGKFFPAFSEKAKKSIFWLLNDEQWQKLENTLVSWPTTKDFPELTPEEIKEYLYFSIYFFNAANHGNSRILRTFLELGKN